MVTVYMVIVPDWYEYATEITDFIKGLDNPMLSADIRQHCSFYMPDIPADEQLNINDEIIEAGNKLRDDNAAEWIYLYSMAYEGDRNGFFSMYGSLFFIGIILSILFIAAAALIIYYKQLSEGYEDQNRFDIMQKVGMTDNEIKSTINAQVLTVFFAPL